LETNKQRFFENNLYKDLLFFGNSNSNSDDDGEGEELLLDNHQIEQKQIFKCYFLVKDMVVW